MGKMVIEAKNVTTAGKKLTELMKGSHGERIFSGVRGRKIGYSDGGKVGGISVEVVEKARHGKSRNVARFLKAGEFCLFQCGEDGMVIKKGCGRITTELGQTEDAHYAKLITRRQR